MREPLSDEQRRRVERELGRVEKVARSVKRLLPAADVDELVSLGHEGLVHAARRYDPESGVPFGAFAHYRIRGAMIDGVRRHGRAGRQHQRALRKLEASTSLLEQAAKDGQGRELPNLQARVAAVRRLVERTAAAAMMSHAKPVEPDQVASAADAEARLVSAELHARLSRSVAGLPPDDRRLVEAIYIEDQPMAVVAERLGINKSTVSRRHSRILGELARELGDGAPPRAGPNS